MEYHFKKLVQLTKDGSTEAAEKLLLSLKPLIISTIKKYARPEMDMEELLQEGYLEVLRLTHDYDEHKKVPYLGYVKKYLKYFFLNYLRGEKVIYESLNREVSIGDEKVELINLISDENSNVEEKYELREMRRCLFDAISRLTIRQQEVIYLYYFSKKPLKRIAKDMNMHYMSIVKLKKRAELKLAGILKTKRTRVNQY